MSVELGCWEAIREWLIAAGTIGATLVALYVGVIRAWIRRPNLSLSFDPGDRTDAQIVGMKITGHPKGGTRAGYARLRVTNANRKNTAEEVQVLVEQVRIVDPGSSAARDSENIGELPLAVSGSWPTADHLNLPPGVGRHFDCVHIRKDQIERGSLYVNLDVQPQPADMREKIVADAFEVDVVITSRNADARATPCTSSLTGSGRPTRTRCSSTCGCQWRLGKRVPNMSRGVHF